MPRKKDKRRSKDHSSMKDLGKVNNDHAGRVDSGVDTNGHVDSGVQTNGGAWFYVNKFGFPLDNFTWERMWEHVAKLHPDGYKILQIRSGRNLPEVPFPHAPLSFPPDTSTPDKIVAIQEYFRQLQYNHTGTQFFDIKKNRPLCGLMDCAKDMIRESLPIKCLEAVILGVYLTNYFPGLDRFPISFRSLFKGNVHKHVVLGLHYNGKYGVLGMSRRDDLMYKPLEYTQLSEIVLDFDESYKSYGHTLDKVKIGLTVPHDSHTYECIQWRVLNLNMRKLQEEDVCRGVDRFSREIRKRTTCYQTDMNNVVEVLPKSSLRNSVVKKSSNFKTFARSKSNRRERRVSKTRKLSLDMTDPLPGELTLELTEGDNASTHSTDESLPQRVSNELNDTEIYELRV